MDPSEEVLYAFSTKLDLVKEWFMSVSPVLGAVLVAASVIWVTAIAWRKFKETTNKV